MKITKRQFRRIIREEATKLLEYEQHVYTDKDGVTWLIDDEGNRQRKSSQFGRQYGGDSHGTTYGLNAPWSGGSSSGPRYSRKTSYVGKDANTQQIAAVKALNPKPNTFLGSILKQLDQGRGLSGKQKAVVRKIMAKRDPESVALFEGRKMKVTKHQLRRIINESLLCEANTDVYEGDHDPIRIEIPALEAIATEENWDGEKVWFSDSDASEIADMLENGPPDIESFDYDDEYYEEALAEWEKLSAHIGDFDDTDMGELAQNIRDGIQAAKDAGYEY